jgi:hypothetical protein
MEAVTDRPDLPFEPTFFNEYTPLLGIGEKL